MHEYTYKSVARRQEKGRKMIMKKSGKTSPLKRVNILIPEEIYTEIVVIAKQIRFA